MSAPEPPADKRAVREAASILRALHASCPHPTALPGTYVLRHLALHLRLDLPDVIAAGDARRIQATGLKPEYAAALFRSFADSRGAVDRLRAGADCLLQGLPPAHLKPALELWEGEAAERLRRDPYGAVFELKGTLDDAQLCSPGLAPAERMVQHARWLLRAARRDGHTMASYPQVVTRVAGGAGVPVAQAVQALAEGMRAGKLARVGPDGLADPDLCAAEMAIAQDIAQRCHASPVLDVEAHEFQGLTPDQQLALRAVLSAGIGILTGGPGTGKSHVVRALVEAVGEDLCLLTAPTGRAARHVGGSTVHSASGGRLLRRPLQETSASDVAPGLKVMVVDEASMLSTELMTGVLNLAPRDCVVVLVGDADQLPPVGAGNVLIDLIDSGGVPVGRLTYNHRSVTEVQRIARDVLEGRVPEEPLDWEAAVGREDGMAGVVRAAAGAAGTAACGVLTPHNASRHLLSRALQSCVRDVPVRVRPEYRDAGPGQGRAMLRTDPASGQSTIRFGGAAKPLVVRVGDSVTVATPIDPLLPGDSVMVLRNQNKKRRRPGEVSACNGDVGELVRLTPKAIVKFEDGVSEFPGADPWLTLAYAATVHKFQGSECDRVVLPVYSSSLWDRQLLYTAITRARHRVTFVGSRRDLETIVARRRPARRSALSCMLAEALSVK